MQPVDLTAVPARRLSSGDLMPGVGLGTFGSDGVPHSSVATAVVEAAAVGYRHFDCASVYGNEQLIGQSLQTAMTQDVLREDLWITSKVWNDMHGPGDVRRSCQQSLRDLQLDYLDLYLVHWPFPNHHAPGVDQAARDAKAVPYRHEEYMETWGQMEALLSQGLVRNIGTSNMTIAKMDRLLDDATARPVANEMELHPHFQQSEFFEYLLQRDIQPIGFSPIGSPARPERDRTPEDSTPTEDPVVQRIAAAHNIHPATLCVKWATQRGQVPIPFSTTPRNFTSNLKAVTSAPLSVTEMDALASVDRNCRLIKGQVFLWEGASGWEDLWDIGGSLSR